MGLRESSLIGCHLKYGEASASIKQNLWCCETSTFGSDFRSAAVPFSCYNFVMSWVPAYWDCKVT